jgi:hypothetical protein
MEKSCSPLFEDILTDVDFLEHETYALYVGMTASRPSPLQGAVADISELVGLVSLLVVVWALAGIDRIDAALWI